MIDSFAEKIATVLNKFTYKQHYIKHNVFEWSEKLRRLKNTAYKHNREWLYNGRLKFGVIFDAR